MYKLTKDGAIIKQGLGRTISFPPDENNRDYREYLRWLDAGNTPEPADPEPVVEHVPTADEKIQVLTDALVSSGVIATRDVELALSAEVVKR